jgi:hypothetical protein
MSAVIIDAEGQQSLIRNADDTAVINTVVDFPGELLILLDGKNNNTDTLLNDSGEIVQDKFIQLTKIIVDKITVPDYFLQKWPVINDSITTTYFGFNGAVKLQFDEPNSFYWLLKTKK